jgi:hypothetical protein
MAAPARQIRLSGVNFPNGRDASWRAADTSRKDWSDQMTVKSWPGVIGGAFIALVLPTSMLLAAKLIEGGIPLIERGPDTMQTLTTVELSELLLGPVGIAIAGKAAGLRQIGWLLLVVVAIPVLAVFWFLGAATLSGALGSPF